MHYSSIYRYESLFIMDKIIDVLLCDIFGPSKQNFLTTPCLSLKNQTISRIWIETISNQQQSYKIIEARPGKMGSLQFGQTLPIIVLSHFVRIITIMGKLYVTLLFTTRILDQI